MGLKKYEIITVGSDKRVRALRSWQVGDRYVNIGDVGGIVYDEKTLSQDGACWLFRGNFNFPGARIGGDSIVDVGEATLSTAGAPNVDILGSSVVVGSKLQFASDQTAADAVQLTASHFEQGAFNYAAGANWEAMKAASGNYIRTKNPIFAGGNTVTLKCEVPGYLLNWYALDRDGTAINASAMVTTGVGVTTTVTACQYFLVKISKNPNAPTVPADATAAQITFTGTYETKLSVIDSRVEINPATSAGTTTIRPGGTYTIASGAKYPEAIIRNSRVSMMVHATANRSFRLMGQIIGSTATLDATARDLSVSGQYGNVKNLTVLSALTSDLGLQIYNGIQATNCDNFKIDSTVIPPGGFNAAISANMPFIFQGCNVPGGKFYHHAQIANTYKNIDFAKAQTDLGKIIGSGYSLASAEVEGMYRLYSTTGSAFGGLVEGYDSVKSLSVANAAGTYGTTIYKDAYFNGLFDIAGTNVFGNTMKHEASNTQDVSGVLVKGLFNATTNGSTISGVVANNAQAVVSQPFRVSGVGGISVSSPAGVECNIYLTDAANKIIVNTGYVSGDNAPITPALTAVYAYVAVRKADGSGILSLDEFKGVTVTTHNGCKIVNTGKTAVSMKGNIRVEDNATLINASVTGTGYFGGNAVASGLRIGGAVFMSDNTSFVKTGGVANIRNLKMTDNAKAVIGDVVITGSVHIKDNAVFTPTNLYVAEADFYLQDNSKITSDVSVNGSLVLKDAANVNNTLTVIGAITLCGSYNQTAAKTWTGKRVIDNENAPEYDNNVKTQYDF
nr:MAG TPA: Putative transferase, nesg, ydcK, Structural Genomics.38A [Caudoviricetes sp.]